MSIMVSVEFSLQEGKQKEFLNILGNVLPDTRAYDGCIKVETYAEDNGSSIILIEEWETKEHQQAYFQWRVDTGMVNAIGPFVSAPPEIKYYEIRSE
ncbi:MAG: antibiotic biosynthesis monooxygenase [Rhodobacteraceae bacterium]|nr:antibiotic biosynthesis monooxygenase [Paracoccaceae bacterium]